MKTLSHRVGAPGAYHVRAVVRDAASGRVGSASQLVEVPDLDRGHLALSGVMLQADEPGPGRSASPRGTPAQRVFEPGECLAYSFVVMNAKVDRSSGKPRLEARAAVLKDGKRLSQGPTTAVDVQGTTDPERIVAGGRLQLDADLPPGVYALQVVVTDALASGRHRNAAQAIDFEVAR